MHLNQGHQRGGYASSGSYGSGATSSAHFQSTSVMLNETACPYYQLYGPPPSYETVIAEKRAGKVHSPSLGVTGSNVDAPPVGFTNSQAITRKTEETKAYNRIIMFILDSTSSSVWLICTTVRPLGGHRARRMKVRLQTHTRIMSSHASWDVRSDTSFARPCQRPTQTA